MPTLKSLQNLQKSRFWRIAALIFVWSCTIATPTFAQSFSVLFSFTGAADGANPSEGLVLDSAGNLFGTTQYGGTGNCTQYGVSGCGTVFKVTNQGTETVLYSFQGGSDGEYPWGGLALGNQHELFGTTANGGVGFGVVFSLNESGTEHIVHRFTGGMDGAYPYAGLMLDRAGHLYGTSTSGGVLHCGDVSKACGTLFELNLNRSKEAGVHRFAGTPSDGNFPGYGAVLTDSTGNLYGATGSGGDANFGTVYKIDRNGKYSVLYSFSGGSDGCEPLGTLAADENGNLYGASSACGDFNKGTLFKIKKTGSFTLLHTFSGAVGDGNSPMGGVTRDRKGNLYGTTLFGGNCSPVEGGCGTVFKFGPDGSMTLLHIFDGYTDGMAPWGNVSQDAAGNLYGTTSSGGLGGNGFGTVWKIAP